MDQENISEKIVFFGEGILKQGGLVSRQKAVLFPVIVSKDCFIRHDSSRQYLL